MTRPFDELSLVRVMDERDRLNVEANALLNRVEEAERRAARFEAALRVIATDQPPPFMHADYQEYAREVLESVTRPPSQEESP